MSLVDTCAIGMEPFHYLKLSIALWQTWRSSRFGNIAIIIDTFKENKELNRYQLIITFNASKYNI